eukprot:1081308-Alexandrium_andersonii.AAC.1
MRSEDLVGRGQGTQGTDAPGHRSTLPAGRQGFRSSAKRVLQACAATPERSRRENGRRASQLQPEASKLTRHSPQMN